LISAAPIVIPMLWLMGGEYSVGVEASRDELRKREMMMAKIK